jgi:hypothetical protein
LGERDQALAPNLISGPWEVVEEELYILMEVKWMVKWKRTPQLEDMLN